MAPTQETAFHKSDKMNNIAVYLITFLKSKWKNKQIKIGTPGYDDWSFIYVIEDNLQRH